MNTSSEQNAYPGAAGDADQTQPNRHAPTSTQAEPPETSGPAIPNGAGAMKNLPRILAFAALGLVALPVVNTTAVAADVGVSISVGQPGFYGRIDVGDYPPPRLVYRQPVMIERENMGERDPVYLRVPRNHRRNWSRNCGRYNACGEQVYFVQDRWYNDVYAPRYQYRHRHHHRRHDDGSRYQSDRGNEGDRGNDNRDRHHDDDRRGDNGDRGRSGGSN